MDGPWPSDIRQISCDRLKCREDFRVRMRKRILGMCLALSAPVAGQEPASSAQRSLFSDEQKDIICYGFADLGVAAIEAREAGVPINVVLEHIREMPIDFMPDEESSDWLRSIIREGIVKTYAEPSLGRQPNRYERQQLINRFTAECLVSFDDSPMKDE